MKLLLAVATIALTVISSAHANNITIDFDGPTSFSSIADYYNGGADSSGVVGPNLGVTFGGDVLGLQNDILGPYYSNAPSPIGVATVVGPDASMNFAFGFTQLSFYYTSSEQFDGGVQVWSGLNGSGTLLASFDLAKNSEEDGPDRYSQWDLVSQSWSGTAHSATFSNAIYYAGFDNVTITAVPEPSSVLLGLMGIVGVITIRRRR